MATGDYDLPELYDFQDESIEQLRDGIRRNVQGQILSSPTGSGKLVIARHMIASAARKGKRAIFTVDRTPLLKQTSKRFYEAGIEHGIIGGGLDYGISEPIQIATVQTLAKRGWPDADIIFIDECHIQYEFLTETLRARSCPYIGLTATPLSRGLGRVYDEIVSVTTTEKLLNEKRLAEMVIRPAIEIDMDGAPLVNGEWTAGEIQARGRKIIGDIVSTWVEETNNFFGGPVKTMLFSASIAHGEELCQEFQAAGFDFRQVSAHDNADHVHDTIEAFELGKCTGIVSVDMLGRGIDIPDVLCLIIARPYNKAIAAHIQMLGRLMRTAPGKKFGLVLDHAGNCLGFYHQTADFFENGVAVLDDRKFQKTKRSTDEEEKKELVCKGCGAVLPPKSPICPVCGIERKRRSDIEAVPGTMITIEPIRKGRAWKGTESELWSACCTAAARNIRRHNDQERAHRQAKAHFHDLTGNWPPRHYRFIPGSYVPKAVERAIAKKYRDWKKAQKQAATT